MNLNAIRKTAICRFENKERVFIVESPLLDICIGADRDEARAWQIFDEILSDMHVEYLRGVKVGHYKLAKSGAAQPAGNLTTLHVAVIPDTKATIEAMAAEIGCSQGEALDYMVFVAKHFQSNSPPITKTAPAARKPARR